MSDKPTNGQAAGDAEPTASTEASPETDSSTAASSAAAAKDGRDPDTNKAKDANATDTKDANATSQTGDIAIEVETMDGASDVPGVAAVASGADKIADDEIADDEIAIEVDTRESEAAERIAQLEAEKADLDKQRQDNWERLLRATADLENFRKRARRDVEDTRIDSRTKVLRPMLEVIDNLERAVDHAESVDNPEKAHAAILEGVKMVLRQFNQVLERFEVKPVDAVGEPFDPNLHEAISQVESPDFVSGSVISSPQKGYTIGDRLLRPSLVVVSKGPPADAPATAEGAGGDETPSAESATDAEPSDGDASTQATQD